MSEKSCAQRISKELKDRIKEMHQFQKMMKSPNDQTRDKVSTMLSEWSLAVSSKKVIRIELSYGGPQDYFDVIVDEGGNIESIIYHFLDWFDGAQKVLQGDDLEIAEYVLGWFTEIVE